VSLPDIKALTFDTGGTVLDWHTGFRQAFAVAGTRHVIKQERGALTNELRRRANTCRISFLQCFDPE